MLPARPVRLGSRGRGSPFSGVSKLHLVLIWLARGIRPRRPRKGRGSGCYSACNFDPMAAKNKCLAQSNKSRTRGRATKKWKQGRLCERVNAKYRRCHSP